jgi:hypothetical protein
MDQESLEKLIQKNANNPALQQCIQEMEVISLLPLQISQLTSPLHFSFFR